MKEKSIKKTYLYNLIWELVVFLSPLITTPYISRVLQPDGIGISSFTASILSYFTLLGSLGVASYGQKEIAARRNDKMAASKLFWELIVLHIFTYSFSASLFFAYVFLSNTQYKSIYVLQFINLFASMVNISWFFKAYEEIKKIVIRNIIIRIAGITAIYLFIKTKDDVWKYVLLMGLTSLCSNLCLWVYVPKFVCKVNIKELRPFSHVKNTFVYFVPSIATTIYTVLDKSMLGFITHSNYQNGFYEQSHKIINISKGILTSLNTVMLSRMSFLFAQKKYDEIKERLNKSIHFVFCLGLPIMIGICIISRNFVPLFFGKGYDEVSLLLKLFSPIVLIVGISNCLGTHYFTPSGQRARSNKVLILSAIVNFCLNLCLIPLFSARGAAIASVTAELLITILYLKMANDFYPAKKILLTSKNYLISVIIMTITGFSIDYFAKDGWLKLILEIFICAVIYAIMLIILKDEFVYSYLKQFFSKIRRKRNKSTDDKKNS